eukprot:TRINITY_DN451_c0_g1_i4.p1 TRINITY_DN451_c0_g1~~TRINITY_DN451_c0_g1_i4.p1  ORF type:complete len:287 (+),score=43.34 TRINITY_DN451_c0_g1_i4:718-1578(+)
MHGYNPVCIQGISLMSSVGKPVRMDGWNLTQYMIECDNVESAELIKEELDEVIISSGNHMMLLSIEYTSEKKNDIQQSKPKHLFVRREQQGASQWCTETLQEREQNRKQIEVFKKSIAAEKIQPQARPQVSLQSVPKRFAGGGFQTVPLPVVAFPCNPDDASDDVSISPRDNSVIHSKELVISEPSSDRSRHGLTGCSKPDTDITRLIHNCLSTVSEKFQVPSTHKEAVIMGAAAFAILSGHYPSDEGEDVQTVWSRLINQLETHGLCPLLFFPCPNRQLRKRTAY